MNKIYVVKLLYRLDDISIFVVINIFYIDKQYLMKLFLVDVEIYVKIIFG